MADKREQILTRIQAILGGIEGLDLVLRNDIEIPEDRLPAAVLLDGDEQTRGGSFDRKRPAYGPLIMDMMPEIYVLTQNDPAEVGQAISGFRGKIVQALCTDPQLARLAFEGDIRYMGMQTGLALGRSVQGEMGMMFHVAYHMDPARLVPPPSTETES